MSGSRISLVVRTAVASGALLLLAVGPAAAWDKQQCVKNVLGSGIVAKVSWYNPSDLTYDNHKLSQTAGPVKQKKIAVTEKSCITKDQPMTAVVRVVGGKWANLSVVVAADTVIAVGGVAVCVGTSGVACAAAAAGGATVATALVTEASSQLPDPKDIFYVGTPIKLEVSGTVWKPKAKEKGKH